jgi:hypothetical protein
MRAKVKGPSVATLPPVAEPPADEWQEPPATTKDCLARIRTLRQRIDGHVRFICALSKLEGTSAEAKQKAAAAFYDRLRNLERALGRIQEELRLG